MRHFSVNKNYFSRSLKKEDFKNVKKAGRLCLNFESQTFSDIMQFLERSKMKAIITPRFPVVLLLTNLYKLVFFFKAIPGAGNSNIC